MGPQAAQRPQARFSAPSIALAPSCRQKTRYSAAKRPASSTGAAAGSRLAQRPRSGLALTLTERPTRSPEGQGKQAKRRAPWPRGSRRRGRRAAKRSAAGRQRLPRVVTQCPHSGLLSGVQPDPRRAALGAVHGGGGAGAAGGTPQGCPLPGGVPKIGYPQRRPSRRKIEER